MHVLIAYDISDNRTRQKLFAFLREKGVHSQKSVFECEMGQEDLRSVQQFTRALDLQQRDSVVMYPLCKRCSRRAIILGQGIQLTQTDWMVI